MFERFTDRARRVVVLAQEEARMLGLRPTLPTPCLRVRVYTRSLAAPCPIGPPRSWPSSFPCSQLRRERPRSAMSFALTTVSTRLGAVAGRWAKLLWSSSGASTKEPEPDPA